MDITFDSVAFALFLAAHLLAAVALTAQQPRSDRGGTARCAVAHPPSTRSSRRIKSEGGPRRGMRYGFDASLT
jgi:hypothetical protein